MTTMLRAVCLVAATLLSACGGPTRPLPPDAAACLGCHGPDGRSDGNAIPTLAGMPRDTFRERMDAFKAGEGTIMDRIAPGYSNAEIERMADYFAEMEPRE